MELGFNLLFLAIAVAAFCFWLRIRPSDSRQVGLLRGALVLACILVLLFPSISITDDLHSTSDVTEETSFAARKVHVILLVHVVAAVAVMFQLREPVIAHSASVQKEVIVLPQVSLPVVGCRAPPLV